MCVASRGFGGEDKDVSETEQEKRSRRELEAAGQQAIRADLNFDGGVSTGGATKLQLVMQWLHVFHP
jgi:hypothetical protein